MIGARHCQWCKTGEGPLTSIGVVGCSGPGWDYYACRPCLVERRSIPLEWHPPVTRGAPRTYPKIVPLPVIVKLAALLDRAPELRPDLTPVIGRLLEAADVLGDRRATADARAAADEAAREAVAELRDSAGRTACRRRKGGPVVTGEYQVMEVTASSIRINDRMLVDGQQMTVVDLTGLPRGAKLLHFDSGRHRKVEATIALTVLRPLSPTTAGRKR